MLFIRGPGNVVACEACSFAICNYVGTKSGRIEEDTVSSFAAVDLVFPVPWLAGAHDAMRMGKPQRPSRRSATVEFRAFSMSDSCGTTTVALSVLRSLLTAER